MTQRISYKNVSGVLQTQIEWQRSHARKLKMVILILSVVIVGLFAIILFS